VEVMKKRKGLGKTRHEKMEEQQIKQLNQTIRTQRKVDFRVMQSERLAHNKLHRDVKRGRRIIQQLDLASGIQSNPLWLIEHQPEEVLAADPWACLEGIDGDTEPERDPLKHHPDANHGSNIQEEDQALLNIRRDEFAPKPVLEAQLREILDHLRYKHCYCLWCRRQFTSKSDMDDICPGVTESMHESLDDF